MIGSAIGYTKTIKSASASTPLYLALSQSMLASAERYRTPVPPSSNSMLSWGSGGQF